MFSVGCVDDCRNGCIHLLGGEPPHKRVVYSGLLVSGELNEVVEGIDRQAEEMFSQLVAQMKQAEGVTEQLKAADQMKWVGMMNNIRNRAEEIVFNELIYR